MTVRSKEAEQYRQEVQEIASEYLTDCLEGCVAVRLVLHPKMPKDWERRLKKDPQAVLSVSRMDLDNAQKVALDALQGIGFVNDRQITDLSIRLGQPLEGGGLAVRLMPDEFWESPV
jgi:crossover junction endodeoxyribonuclease RusA